MFKYLRFLVIILFVGLVACEKHDTLPNIVLIIADDMGYECLGCNGNTEYETPNLDRLAEQGIRFDNCYSQPLCTPSRVKLMTGKYNFRNYEDFGYLNPKEQTFGNLLKNAGYATCVAGKWQLNGLNRNNPGNHDINRPHQMGFDEYCLWQLNHKNAADAERYANALITQNGKDLPRDPDMYGPRIFAEYVKDFINRKAGQPFFVYYPMVLVHDPFVPTPDSPEWNEPERRYERDTAYFADMVAYTDKIVGEIETCLKENKLWENTLFIFTGDNGTHPTVLSATKSGIVKGAKGETINTGNHVPFIVNWPEKIKRNITEKAVISFADILPTLCTVAGIDQQEYETDGHNILPLFDEEKDGIQDEIFIHYTPRWGNWGSYHNRWVMDDNYKLYHDGRFFNTKKDPLEMAPLTELTKEEQELKQRFQKLLDEKEAEIPFEMNNTTFKLKN